MPFRPAAGYVDVDGIPLVHGESIECLIGNNWVLGLFVIDALRPWFRAHGSPETGGLRLDMPSLSGGRWKVRRQVSPLRRLLESRRPIAFWCEECGAWSGYICRREHLR
jgi:hypothetical protein